MTATNRAVIVSDRRLIADCVRLALGENAAGSDLRCDVVGSADQLRMVVPEGGVLIVDLDEPGRDVDELRLLSDSPGWMGRMGIFDGFDARGADLAFELGLTMLCPLTSTGQHIANLVFGEQETTVTAAHGVTRHQLNGLRSLTPRELEVLQHLAAGRPVQVISFEMGISGHTVQTHKRRMYAKLDVQSQAQAVRIAIAGGAVAAPTL